MQGSPINPDLYKEVAQFGARDMDLCMQCATCSAACPLSSGQHTFPRKIYGYLQLGLEDQLLRSSEPWLCYYCGECNLDCPRGAEPAETMMAVRRWLTTRYDWTGLARRFYLSAAWEIGALIAIALVVVALFVVGHGPIITERVSVNTFAPVLWIEIGDLTMAAILTFFLMSNAWRMFRLTMAGTHIAPSLYVKEAGAFVLHFLTQKRWRQCGEDRSRWLKHFILVSGYLTMMTLVIVFIRWFQVDDSSWHFTSIFGYYATGVLLVMTVEMFRSRLRQAEALHRYSELSDWLFLILLFGTTLTGIVMHAVRLAGWPMGTYVMYVIHLAVAVPMLVIEVPFGKWSHLFYRPLALFLAAVKERAVEDSQVDVGIVSTAVGDTFMSCLQCGTCTSLCPGSQALGFSPRQVMRQLTLDRASVQAVDAAVWSCTTCRACEPNCPRGIEIIDLMLTVRQINLDQRRIPDHLHAPLDSLRRQGNPWGGQPEARTRWLRNTAVQALTPSDAYALFTCCTTAYTPGPSQAGLALPQLLRQSGTPIGHLGTAETCCGDPALGMGDRGLFRDLRRSNLDLFESRGVKHLIVSSPHCLTTFKNHYAGLSEWVSIEHYTLVLDRLIAEGRLIPALEIVATVTYHDPCYLGRHSGIYQAPRRVLQRIPGLELVEMANHQDNSRCCGGGGCGAWTKAAKAPPEASWRVEEALETTAQIIATACPYCLRILDQAVREMGVEDRIGVRDIAELLLQSVEVKVDADRLTVKAPEIDQEVCHG